MCVGLATLFAGEHSHASTLVIDHVDTKNFKTRGELVFFADVLDGRNKPLTEQDPTKIQVRIDGQPVAGKFVVETAREADEFVALGILIAAHTDYNQPEPNILSMQKEGYERLLSNLSANDKVALWFYNDQTMKTLAPWSSDPGGVGRIPRPERAGGESPKLYYALAKAMEDFKTEEGLPRRKILLVVSDGADDWIGLGRRRFERKIANIPESAKASGTKIYALGLSLASSEHLVHLAKLANATGGIYRELGDHDVEGLADTLEGISKELREQYVITFTPDEYRGDDETRVEILMELEASDGSKAKRVYAKKLIVPERPIDWPKYLTWAGIALGALLGLWLLFKLIGALIRRRANRPVYVEEDGVPVGVYKGKLMVQSGGELAGDTFYLCDDVTTIGTLKANQVPIVAKGISKRHAGIKIEDMRFELADFGSTNGTFVNGTRIEKQFLRDGDVIRVGEVELRFSLK